MSLENKLLYLIDSERRLDMQKTFTLFWLDGQKETLHGDTLSEAMTMVGYGNGAVRALDFYAEGKEADQYTWDKKEHKWINPNILNRG